MEYYFSNSSFWLYSLLFLLTSFIIYLYLKVVRRDPKCAKYLKDFPSRPAWPIFGNTLDFMVKTEKLIEVTDKYIKECGKTSICWFFNYPFLICADPNHIEKILSSSTHIEKGTDYEKLIPWLGTGLLISSGNKWHQRRKMLTPAFHFNILEDFIDIFNEQSLTLVGILKNTHSDGKVFNIFPFISRCTLDIICETAMGKKINAQNDPDSSYLKAVYGMCAILIKRILTPWLYPDILWRLTSYSKQEKEYLKILHGFTQNVIKERQKERKKLNNSKNDDNNDENSEENFYKRKNRLAFLDLLIDASEDGKYLSDSDIREEVDTFMFEGHDTTAAAINWVIYLLGLNPICQRQVQEEVDHIFEDDNSRTITMADLGQMKYLECCIKESLRLYPSVPMIARKMNEDLQFDDGRIVPEGTEFNIYTYALHRDPSIYQDPEKFIPERFLPENSSTRGIYTYIPFSAGARNCIGQKFAIMEEKIIMAQLLRNFNFQSVEGRDEIILNPALLLRPKNGIKVKITKRN